MSTKKHLRTAALVGVVSALAVPAVASAHPSVYALTAKVAATPATTPPIYNDQTRYAIANDGVAFALRETNGATAASAGNKARGIVNYAVSQGRTGAAILDSDASRTGVQAHATCDVPALETTSAILSWQKDPFYDYVPFQAANSGPGLKDDPAKWIPVVKNLTGVDLSALPDTDAAREAACEALPGATASSYSPADATQSSVASLSSALIADTQKATAAPFEARIATFQETIAAAQAKQAATDGQLAAANAKLAQVSATTLAAPAPKPLAAKLAKSSFTASAIASSGVPVSVTGPAGQRVRVRATISAGQARKHGLRSTILGSKSGTVGQDGTTSITVKPSAAQGKKLKAVKGGSVPVTLELVVGTTKATVSR